MKLDGAGFDKCLDSGAKSELIAGQLSEAQALGLNGTPSFFINGRAVVGNLTVEQLRDVINEELGIVVKKPNPQTTASR